MRCQHCINELEGVSGHLCCDLCLVYQSRYDVDLIEQETSQFVSEAREDGAALVEFSGGRHSTIALALARLRLGLSVIAVSFRNRFVPIEVVDQAKRICANLGVRYIVVEGSFDAFGSAGSDEPPMQLACDLCNRHLNSIVIGIGKKLGLRWVANGENKYCGLHPKVSALGRIRSSDGFEIKSINLPFALRVTRAGGERILEELGWRPLNVPGPSSNCLIPWLSLGRNAPLRPGNPVFDLIAAEVRSGYLSQAEGLAEIRRVAATKPGEGHTVSDRVAKASDLPSVPRITYDSGVQP